MDFQLDAERLRGAKIFLGCPMYDGRCQAEFTYGLCRLSVLCAQFDIGLELFFASGEALVMKARNAIADRFLRSDATHLMLIDADIGFAALDVLSLLDLQMGDRGRNDYDVVSAPYPIKRMAWDRIARAVRRGLADEDSSALAHLAADLLLYPARRGSFDVGAPLEVSQAGTGFMMIRRPVLERFQESYPHRRYKSDSIGMERDCSALLTQFFDTAIDGQADTLEDDLRQFLAANPQAGHDAIRAFLAARAQQHPEYVSEDFMFCRLVRRMGMKIWSCPWMTPTHIGSHAFSSRLADIARLQS